MKPLRSRFCEVHLERGAGGCGNVIVKRIVGADSLPGDWAERCKPALLLRYYKDLLAADIPMPELLALRTLPDGRTELRQRAIGGELLSDALRKHSWGGVDDCSIAWFAQVVSMQARLCGLVESARIDTNTHNFIIVPDGGLGVVTLVDIVPALYCEKRRNPSSEMAEEALFNLAFRLDEQMAALMFAWIRNLLPWSGERGRALFFIRESIELLFDKLAECWSTGAPGWIFNLKSRVFGGSDLCSLRERQAQRLRLAVRVASNQMRVQDFPCAAAALSVSRLVG